MIKTKTLCSALIGSSIFMAAANALFAEAPSGSAAPAIVSHVKVLSNKVEDISSLEAWQKSFIKPGMSDKEKALAIWTTVVKFRQQTAPPNEYLDDDANVHDPIKNFNVYGYGMCCCASAGVESLSRYVGLEARGWGINNHSVPEIKIDGHWSLLDASLINYFNLPDGKIAGVMEVSNSITKWLDEHPDYKKFSDHKLYYAIMRKGEWKKNGPEVLKGSATYDDNGWQPAKTHAWGDTIFEYGSNAVPIKDAHKPFLFDYGSALGYEVNIQLRPGEKLIRNWSNKGLDVNQLETKKPASILADSPQNPKGDLAYAQKYGDLTDGRAGNGTLEYTPPLDTLQSTALTYENLTVTDGRLRIADPAKPATLVIRMPSSYVYLTGKVIYEPMIGSNGDVGTGAIITSISDNNGLDWKPLMDETAGGAGKTNKIDYSHTVQRKYDYRLKFEFKGAGTGLNSLTLTHDIQHSQRVLPILDKGDTTISFSAAEQTGTITVNGNLPKNGSDPAKAKNLLFSDFHPILKNVNPSRLIVNAGTGTVIVPISAPGTITRIRIGAFYRATTAADKWTAEVSFDDGKTFTPITTLDGPNNGNSKYVVFGGDDKIPANSRAALVRLTGNASANDRLWMQDLRIDADYKEPHGGFLPVKITYAYEENGTPKTDTHIAKSPEESYTIHCDTKPKMKSITLELAQ